MIYIISPDLTLITVPGFTIGGIIKEEIEYILEDCYGALEALMEMDLEMRNGVQGVGKITQHQINNAVWNIFMNQDPFSSFLIFSYTDFSIWIDGQYRDMNKRGNIVTI